MKGFAKFASHFYVNILQKIAMLMNHKKEFLAEKIAEKVIISLI